MSQIELRPAETQHAEKIAGLAPSPEDLRQAAPQELAPLNAHVVGQWIRERAAGYILTLDDEIGWIRSTEQV